MPRPESSSIAVPRHDLAVLAYEYMASQTQFIGLEALPILGVPKRNGVVPYIRGEDILAVKETRRAPRSNYPRGDWEYGSLTYETWENGFEYPVDDAEAAEFKAFFNAERTSAEIAALMLLRVQERRIADLLFNATTFSGYTSGVGTEWSTTSTATPIDDCLNKAETVEANCGMRPNTLIIGSTARNNLDRNAQIRDRIKYTNPAVGNARLSDELLAQALGVDRVLVGRARYNDADKGKDYNAAEIWDDEYALLCVTNPVAPTDMGQTPNLGRTVLWTEDSPTNLVVERYRDETVRGEVVRVRQNTDERVLFANTGYLLSNITS